MIKYSYRMLKHDHEHMMNTLSYIVMPYGKTNRPYLKIYLKLNM